MTAIVGQLLLAPSTLISRMMGLHRECTRNPVTVAHRGIGTGLFEASERVPIFFFATQGGKQAGSYFRQRNWVQAREAQIQFPAGGPEFDNLK